MPKTLRKPGKNTSAEVQGISDHGLWLLVEGREHYLPFSQYPWFQGGTVRQVFNLTRPSGKHLRWPDLDVDLELESLVHPEAYPVVFRAITRPRHAPAL